MEATLTTLDMKMTILPAILRKTFGKGRVLRREREGRPEDKYEENNG